MQYLITQQELNELKVGTPLDKLAGQIQEEITKLEKTCSLVIDEFAATRIVLSPKDIENFRSFIGRYHKSHDEFVAAIRNLTFKENPMDRDYGVK